MNVLQDISEDPNIVITCNYYSFGSNLCIDKKSLNVLHMNIRSTKTNLDEFLLNLNKFKEKFHFIALTKTYLKSEDDFLEVLGYHSFHRIKTRKKAGSVCLLIDMSFECQALDSLLHNTEVYESVGIEMKISYHKYTILGVYRPPSSSLSAF